MIDLLIDSNEIKNWIIIIAGVGTFLSALVAMFTLVEIKKQRLSTYKPELILDSFCSKLYAKDFLSKNDDLRYITSKYRENNQKKIIENNRQIYIYYLLQNIGFGTAKYIIGEWYFDYKKAMKILKKHIPHNFEIQSNTDSYFIKNLETDALLVFFKSSLSKDSIDYILPEQTEENGKGQAIPSIISDIFTYYIVFKYNINTGLNNDPIYEEFKDLPKPKFQVQYKDFNGKKHSKKFELTINYAGNSIEIPNQPKDDCGIFYIDVKER